MFIEGHIGRYSVDQNGVVFSHLRGRKQPMKPILCSDGYARVSIHDGMGGKKSAAIHRLVCLAFLDADECRQYVNHKNGVKTDNRLSNLEWVTPKENARHAVETGLHKMSKKVCDEHIFRAASLRVSGFKLREIAAEIGVSITTAHTYIKSKSAEIMRLDGDDSAWEVKKED